MALFHTHFFFFFFFPSIMITTRSFALHYLFSLFAVECVEFLFLMMEVTSFLTSLKMLPLLLCSRQNRSSLVDTNKHAGVLNNNNNYFYYYYQT